MRIVSCAEHLPGEPIDNEQLARRFGLHGDWLEKITGNRTRHLCEDDPNATELTTELAYQAAHKAMKRAQVCPEEIEFLILSTATPDYLMPTTAALVADRLGLNGMLVLQLTSGCAGATQGLLVAKDLLAAGRSKGVVVGADCCMKIRPSSSQAAEMDPSELVNFALFGDGAGAAVVSAQDQGPGFFVQSIFNRFIGKGRKPGQIARWYGRRGAPSVIGRDGKVEREAMAHEDYKAIEKEVPKLAKATLEELCAENGWQLPQVEHVLMPQLSGAMSKKIQEVVGANPEQVVDCVSETGNNGNALPFVQLSRLVERIESGVCPEGRAVIACIESSKWIMSGMALQHQSS